MTTTTTTNTTPPSIKSLRIPGENELVEYTSMDYIVGTGDVASDDEYQPVRMGNRITVTKSYRNYYYYCGERRAGSVVPVGAVVEKIWHGRNDNPDRIRITFPEPF